MLFKYQAVTKSGEVRQGTVEAVNQEVAINALQRRGLIVSDIGPFKESWLSFEIPLLNRVSHKDVVMLSRQMASLFEAQLSALRIFRILAEEAEDDNMQRVLTQVSDDIQGGSPIHEALSKHPKVFSSFYTSMVKAGEESGQLDETFEYLANYLERTYELTSKAKHALMYPAVVMVVFISVMLLMFTVIVPQIAEIIEESGEELPVYTEIVLSISDFLVSYGIFLAIAVIVGFVLFFRWVRTERGRRTFDKFKLSLPLFSDLFRKLALSRMADNMSTMITSGISMVQALEVTADVVGNEVYRGILLETAQTVRDGKNISETFSQYEEMPSVMVQMVRVGEETGSLGDILKTMARFYQREFSSSVDTLVGLIEPIMIVVLGLGVGILLASVLMPIYNMTTGAVI